MKLKNYQNEALNRVSHYFSACLQSDAKTAFSQIQPEYSYKIPSEHSNLRDVPYVCVRIPTGGGKTLLASHSIARIARQYLDCDFPVTLWLVPSRTIKTQTAEALKNPQHPYRVALDKTFNREVMVIESEDFDVLRPQDFGNKAIVIVSTIQNFRVENQDGRKIYAFNEKLTAHFERLPIHIQTNLEKISITDLQENGLTAKQAGKIKCSFANLLRAYQPLVIVDEAHNARTSLSFDVLSQLSPAAILEFTATPNTDRKTGSNVLYHVSASHLKAEEMIKLPIVLTEHHNWQQAIDGAVINRGALAQKAQYESDYVRPLVLFQAEPKNGKVTVEILKQYLIDELKIDAEEIAIVTGNQHELDNIDLFNPQCKINYIITVEALKEGWDCPFAYIFCSVQNVSSSKEAEQLLGRVLRMPYAKRRQIEDLNRAYAHLSSKSFGETARNLQDKLIGMGFEALEVAEMLRIPQQENWINENEEDVFYTPPTVLALTQLPIMTDLSEAERSQLKITEQEGSILVQVKGNLSEKLEKALIQTATGKKKEQIEQQLQIHQNRVEIFASPAEKGEIFKVIPQLCMNIQGELDLADSQVLSDYQSWNLLDYPAKLDGFRLQENSQSFEIDVEDKRVSYHFNQQQLSFSDDWLELTEQDFIRWLDKQVRLTDIPQPIMLRFLQLLISDLLKNVEITLTQLVQHKFALARAISDLINRYRALAQKNCYQQTLFGDNEEVEICLNEQYQFSFTPEKLAPQPPFYVGRYKFNKHYFAQIEELKASGEEFDCAVAIDSLPQVKYWVRNPVKRGFSLPLAHQNFYPDFIVELIDGRILIVEYKGEQLKSNEDSKEKALIGNLWEKLSQGKGLFIMAVKSDENGQDVRTQLLNKLA
ncbi:DEAD/DEAH box helicase family protein [Mannheimia sp. HC-2023]|uniref:DEAD/DEAH box helicase n=1 Tax=Mannheimia indoligenes TaxID=3103145 RepID=UPI002FE6687C